MRRLLRQTACQVLALALLCVLGHPGGGARAGDGEGHAAEARVVAAPIPGDRRQEAAFNGCPWDVNGDGVIDVLDLIDLLLCFGLPADPPCDSADINGDGTVNVLDLIDLLLHFGETCPVKDNDFCESPQPIAVGETLNGTTVGATDDDVPACDSVLAQSPGVWYRVIGDGTTLTASTCGPGTFGFDTRLSVYCGDCAQCFQCVGANLDDFDPCGSGWPVSSTVAWCAEPGREYLILVHGDFGTVGDFELSVTSDGLECSAYPQCTEQCLATCDLTCPPGSTPEPEPCGEDVNGGCDENGVMHATQITPGQTICGTAWAFTGRRDADFYEFPIVDANGDVMVTISVTLKSEFPGLAGLIACPFDTCPVNCLETLLQTDPCKEGTIEVLVGVDRDDPSTGLVSVRPQDRFGQAPDGFPCGCGNEYVLTIVVGP